MVPPSLVALLVNLLHFTGLCRWPDHNALVPPRRPQIAASQISSPFVSNLARRTRTPLSDTHANSAHTPNQKFLAQPALGLATSLAHSRGNFPPA